MNLAYYWETLYNLAEIFLDITQILIFIFIFSRFITVIECFSLVGLTLLTSHGKIYAIHETFVGIWITTSQLHMLTSSYLEQNFNQRRSSSIVKIRRILAGSTIIGVFFMLYLYFRHNSRCEPYIYSYFCFIEYAVILSNMIYNMIAPPLIEYPIMTVKNICTKRSPGYNYNGNFPSNKDERAELLKNNIQKLPRQMKYIYNTQYGIYFNNSLQIPP